MSLRVWLPLNGDLRNNGLSNIAIDNSNLTVDNNGKIGKCYSFNGSSSKITNTFSSPISSSIGTLACWVKFNAFPASNKWYTLLHLGNLGGYAACRFGLYMDYTNRICVSVDGSSQKNLYTHSLTTNQWYHICTTYDGNIIKLYIDGTEVMSVTATKGTYTTDSSYLYIGATNNYWLNGYMNDARYYDHALSAKEVKEISKGLVCHYTLNSYSGRENLFNWQNKGSDVIVLNDYQNTGSFTQFTNSLTFDPSTTVGQKYTVSFWARSPRGTTKLQLYNNNTSPRYFRFSTVLTNNLGTEWQFFTYTFTNNDAGSGNESASICRRIEIYMPSQMKGEVKLIKVEQGDSATIWSPSPSDSHYNQMGYNSNIIYDVSGYNNNAQKYYYDTTGTIEASSDTPRNSLSTYINSENNTTNTASGTVFLYGNCELTTPNYLTIAFWCKPIGGYIGQTGQGQFCTTNNDFGINAGMDYNTTAMHNRDNCIDMCTSTSVHKTVNITFTANEWHHYAIIYDGRYGKVYKDGIETSTLDMGNNLSLTSFKAIVIGYSRAGGVYRSNKSYFSDFRIYTTALSIDDIKQLYNTPISIAKNGSMLTQGEYIE